jgi:hypothetical protein
VNEKKGFSYLVAQIAIILLSIADRFDVTVSTVYKSTEYMVSRIINLQNQYMVWPGGNEAITIEQAFQAKAGYPGKLELNLVNLSPRVVVFYVYRPG